MLFHQARSTALDGVQVRAFETGEIIGECGCRSSLRCLEILDQLRLRTSCKGENRLGAPEVLIGAQSNRVVLAAKQLDDRLQRGADLTVQSSETEVAGALSENAAQ